MNIDMILYEKLVQLATDRSLAAYTDVAPLVGLDMSKEQDRDEIARKLGDIVCYEHENQRPMLTALVVHRGNDNNPGEGFFSAAQKINLYKGSRDPIKRLIFWSNQVTDVHNFWATRKKLAASPLQALGGIDFAR